MKGLKFLAVLSVLFCACQNATEKDMVAAPLIKEIPGFCKNGGEPNLFTDKDGQVFLSWIEYVNDTLDELRFSVLKNEEWSQPLKIASGTNWFVNWADFPGMAAYSGNENHLAAYWLAMSAEGTYDYDVNISQSKDGGKTWSTPFLAHKDGVSAEHGFVSMVPITSDRIFTCWLDGRNTKNLDKGEDRNDNKGHGHGGPMILRAAEFDINGNFYEETELDDRVCDCCQTSAAITANGPVVVYRDRSPDEIRDVSIVRKVDGNWTIPKVLHPDHWRITGCPVNGPSIKAIDNFVAVAWFTAADEQKQVKVAFSEDAGANFSTPVQIDSGNPEGRVDLTLLDKKTAMVSWLENNDGGAEVLVAKVEEAGLIGQPIKVAHSSNSRKSGFPVMTKSDDQIIIAWTSLEDEKSTIKTARLTL